MSVSVGEVPVPSYVLGMCWVTTGSESHKEPPSCWGEQIWRERKIQCIILYEVSAKRNHHELGWGLLRRGAQPSWSEQCETKQRSDPEGSRTWGWFRPGHQAAWLNPDVWLWRYYLPLTSIRYYNCKLEIVILSTFSIHSANCGLMCRHWFLCWWQWQMGS